MVLKSCLLNQAFWRTLRPGSIGFKSPLERIFSAMICAPASPKLMARRLPILRSGIGCRVWTRAWVGCGLARGARWGCDTEGGALAGGRLFLAVVPSTRAHSYWHKALSACFSFCDCPTDAARAPHLERERVPGWRALKCGSHAPAPASALLDRVLELERLTCAGARVWALYGKRADNAFICSLLDRVLEHERLVRAGSHAAVAL
eukprot:356056-Chlamydomonas_euryale.AAC.1